MFERSSTAVYRQIRTRPQPRLPRCPGQILASDPPEDMPAVNMSSACRLPVMHLETPGGSATGRAMG